MPKQTKSTITAKGFEIAINTLADKTDFISITDIAGTVVMTQQR